MNRLTRPLNSVSLPELRRSLSLQPSFTKSPLRFSQAIRPPPYVKQLTPLKPLEFSTFASIANRPNYKPELPAIGPKPAELDPPSSDNVSRNERSGSSERRNEELPKELSKSVMVLSCESSAEGGNCDVYLVGTAHVSKESCREVEAVISYLKPQVVFLELCSSRDAVLTPQNLKVPSMEEKMVAMWKKKDNMFGILYGWFLARVASRLEVCPGSEFRVAYEEAMKYGGKVILGDRPVQITLQRTWGKMPLWLKTILSFSLLFHAVFLPSTDKLKKMLKDMDDVDMVTLEIQEMREAFPTLMESLVHERDQFMSATLLRVASEHSSVVAVVGKGHLAGIRKYWKQPVSINDLMTIPSKKLTVSTGKILSSLSIAAAGVAIITGIYLASKK